MIQAISSLQFGTDMDEEEVPPLTPTSHKFLLALAIIFMIIYTYLQLKLLKK